MEHHELASLLPTMRETDFAALKSNIAANGLLHPILMFDGKVLDGRHRLRACEELGLTPKTEAFHGSYDDAIRRVLSLNFARRHLSNAEKREVNKRLKEMLGVRGEGQPSTMKNCIVPPTAKDRADMLGVSHRTVAGWDASDKKEAEPMAKEAQEDKPKKPQPEPKTVPQQAAAKPVQEVEPADPSKMAPTTKAKFDAALRAYQKQMDAKFYEAVGTEVERVVRDVWLPRHQEMYDKAQKVLSRRRGVITKKQYQLIRMCLHPDNAASTEKRAEAFRIFEAIDTVLLFNEEEEARVANLRPLPNFAELFAAQDRIKAERAAKRKSAKAQAQA